MGSSHRYGAGVLALVGTTESPDPVTGSKLNPYVYHSANLLIHVAAALVVYQVLQLLLARNAGFPGMSLVKGSPNENDESQHDGLKPVPDHEAQPRMALQTRIRWGACVGALLFAVHPLQVESVGWVTAMKDLLCGLFSLLAIWRYI